MYKLRHGRFEHPAGTRVYDYHGIDYGLRREDEQMTGIAHNVVTLEKDGSGPFFTVPVTYLEVEVGY